MLAVLVYHLHAPWLPGGFAGVDVFFVLSGFVVSASIAGFQGEAFGASQDISMHAVSCVSFLL